MNHPPSPSHAHDDPQDGGAGARAPGEAQPEERFGPLALRRTHKDDGRLLIFFRDAHEEQP